MTDLIARADVTKLIDPYRTKAEREWANTCKLFLPFALEQTVKAEKLVVRPEVRLLTIIFTHYEPITFRLPGNRYTPDFLHIMSDGSLVFVEVKGSRQQKNYRDARSKLRLAAELWPVFTFVEARQEPGGFAVEVIN